MIGYDETNGRGIYQFVPPARNQIADGLSRWNLLLGMRYLF
jgi:hypothetical protein